MTPIATVGTVALALGLLAGYWVGDAVRGAELANVQKQNADERQAAILQAMNVLSAARKVGDALTADLAAANATAQTLKDQRDEALTRSTTGRACLGSAALRVLDRAAGTAAQLPPASGLPAATNAEPAATDTEVARWANTAYGQYAECARRLDALIQFNESAP